MFMIYVVQKGLSAVPGRETPPPTGAPEGDGRRHRGGSGPEREPGWRHGPAGPRGGPHGFRHGWGSPFAGFTVPAVLLLLRAGERHGYALRDELEGSGLIADVDFGNLYRALRRMEVAGLVDSRWEVGGEGPGRRVYTLTAAGERYLQQAADTLREVRASLDRFFSRYAPTDGERG